MWTDASAIGGGAHLDGSYFQVSWNASTDDRSANWKELHAILLALRNFADKISGALILVHSDSATAVSYGNRGAGSSPPLAIIGRDIKLLEISISCYVVASHVAGSNNTVADSLSRLKSFAVTITSDDIPLLRPRFWTNLLARAPALRIIVSTPIRPRQPSLHNRPHAGPPRSDPTSTFRRHGGLHHRL